MTKARHMGGKARDILFGSVADFRTAFEKAWTGEKMLTSDFKGPVKYIIESQANKLDDL